MSFALPQLQENMLSGVGIMLLLLMLCIHPHIHITITTKEAIM